MDIPLSLGRVRQHCHPVQGWLLVSSTVTSATSSSLAGRLLGSGSRDKKRTETSTSSSAIPGAVESHLFRYGSGSTPRRRAVRWSTAIPRSSASFRMKPQWRDCSLASAESRRIVHMDAEATNWKSSSAGTSIHTEIGGDGCTDNPQAKVGVWPGALLLTATARQRVDRFLAMQEVSSGGGPTSLSLSLSPSLPRSAPTGRCLSKRLVVAAGVVAAAPWAKRQMCNRVCSGAQQATYSSVETWFFSLPDLTADQRETSSPGQSQPGRLSSPPCDLPWTDFERLRFWLSF